MPSTLSHVSPGLGLHMDLENGSTVLGRLQAGRPARNFSKLLRAGKVAQYRPLRVFFSYLVLQSVKIGIEKHEFSFSEI